MGRFLFSGVFMKRRLFCEISPLTYRISVKKCIILRHIKNLLATLSGQRFATKKSAQPLPYVMYRHSSLIRRRLGNADMRLQENKAVNLSIAAPKISGVVINPGETFSFWKLVGAPSAKKGYLEGLTIKKGEPSSDIGGGLCQMSNLIHWLALHSELEIAEHHHHDRIDLFRDYGRKVPFGTGTSIYYNYLDYRLKNNTDNSYQIIIWSDGEYLCGELRAKNKSPKSFHIRTQNEKFIKQGGVVYRTGEVYKSIFDVKTGKLFDKQLIRKNHAKVMYDTEGLEIEDLDLSDDI